LSTAPSTNQLLTTSPQTSITVRHGVGFVGKVTADDLWESATSVSNAGRKRGRAKGLRRRWDLNKGQRVGEGRSGMVFPGLQGHAVQGGEIVAIHKSHAKQEEARGPPEVPKRRTQNVPALQRGFSGGRLPGKSVGPPDPINDYMFEGFDSRVLEFKMVSHMTGNLGRKIRFSSLIATGNKKGLVGFAVAKAQQGKGALRQAKNKAAQRLQYIDLYDGHTVYHNFQVSQGGVKMFVEKQPKGYGLRCHRIIKLLCEMIGISDLRCKMEGTTNPQSMVKGFIKGLMEQETHQRLADRKQLHVVEYRNEMDDIPVVVASPSSGRTITEPITDENFSFENMYYADGKIVLKKHRNPLHQHTHSASAWKSYMLGNRERNQLKAKYERIIYDLEPSKEELKKRKTPAEL